MQLQGLLYTYIGGFVVYVACLLFYGFAVQRPGWSKDAIAPRCAARPLDTIWVSSSSSGASKKNHHHQNNKESKSAADAQIRGNPFTGWIAWVMGLSYDEMLSGIPGTGTRDDGLAGSLLKVNLDGIILLRFNAFCMKVAVLVCILSIFFILPLNTTAQCYDGSGNESCFTALNKTVTDYDKTTMNHVPSLPDIGHFDPRFLDIYFRLSVYVVSAYIVTIFVCRLLWNEWKEVLVLRRVYYLEADHFQNRQEELQSIGCAGSGVPDWDMAKKRRSLAAFRSLKSKRRDPWIPDPEQRETVPNVELYSVLVSGIPHIPVSEINTTETSPNTNMDNDIEEGVRGSRLALDWQLQVTTAFFDHCVPRQPGYSSSVAAVTILPDAPQIAAAWRKWYKAAAALRRLRFIRTLIADRRYVHGADLAGEVEMSSVPTGSTKTDTLDSDDVEEVYKLVTYLGSTDTEEVHSFVLQAMNYGPEQTAVYSREFAQGASNCCPVGCFESRMRRHGIDTLLMLEQNAIDKVKDASMGLKHAQEEAACAKDHVNNNESQIKSVSEPGHKKSTSLDSLPDNVNTEVKLLLNKRTDDAFNQTVLAQTERKNIGNPYATQSKLMRRMSFFQANSSSYANMKISFDSDGRVSFCKSLSAIGEFEFEENFSEDEIDLLDSQSSTNSFIANENNQTSIYDKDDLKIRSKTRRRRLQKEPSEMWLKTQRLRANTDPSNDSSYSCGKNNKYNNESGIWGCGCPSMRSIKSFFLTCLLRIKGCISRTSAKAADNFGDSTFAVITFTSRQAAVAARTCLADGRGTNHWLPLREIPTPPLADAAAMDLKTCRGCCRPVTLTINPKQQKLRRYLTIFMLTIMYVFYLYPITTAVSIAAESVDSTHITAYFPKMLLSVLGKDNQIFPKVLSAILLMTFLALCPVIFKTISNFGSNATSVMEAEQVAMKYYWWFMVVTAFSASTLMNFVIEGFKEKDVATSTLSSILREISETLPNSVSATWINWIVLRTTCVLPLQYLLQINTFLFRAIGWRCCARATVGGGPGGPVPYRIYIDNAVVFMCLVALYSASPIIAPCALFYYLNFSPILRRSLIFVWRPNFDGAGAHFPFIADMIVSSLIVMQIFLCVMLTLKKAVELAVVVIVLIIPTLLFRKSCFERFERPFKDAGLLQASLVDGWEKIHSNELTSREEREKFLNFLVDSHKAAYIPISVAEDDTASLFTAEPAHTLPLETDKDGRSNHDAVKVVRESTVARKREALINGLY